MDEILKLVVQTLDNKKAENINVIDFKNSNPLADYYVICSANNNKQMDALIDAIIEKMEENNYPIRSIEDDNDGAWQLIDCYNVIIHIFSDKARLFYDLDKLFLDKDIISLDEFL